MYQSWRQFYPKQLLHPLLGLVLSYSVVNGEKNTLDLLFEAGMSKFRFDDFNDEEYVDGVGPELQIGGSWRHYFGDRIGMYMNLTLPYYHYASLKNADGEELKTYKKDNIGFILEERPYSISMSGVNFRAGLLIKI